MWSAVRGKAGLKQAAFEFASYLVEADSAGCCARWKKANELRRSGDNKINCSAHRVHWGHLWGAEVRGSWKNERPGSET